MKFKVTNLSCFVAVTAILFGSDGFNVLREA
jgi:hypothetical protein